MRKLSSNIKNVKLLSKTGVILLAMFLKKSEKAKEFRRVAKHIIVKNLSQPHIYPSQTPLKQRTEKLEYAQRQLELFEKAFMRIGIRDKNELAIASNSAVKNETGIDFIELSGKKIVKPSNEGIELTKTILSTNNLIGDNPEKKEKFYKDISNVLTHYPDGISQRNLLAKAGYYQSEKMRRWLHEQISTLWDMSVIAGKGYKYTSRS